MKTLLDIMKKTEEFQKYLLQCNFNLSSEGFPIFDKSMFAEEWPDQIVPYYARNNRFITNPSKTLICNFSKDENLFRRIDKVFTNINEYKKFMGIIGCDVTVTENMDKELTRAIIGLNMLFNAILACNSIKIVMNTRIGLIDDLECFRYIPKGVMWASGFLGCQNIQEEYDVHYIAKILSFFPSKLIIYGKEDKIAFEQLDRMGINYRLYDDVHKMTKPLYNKYNNYIR